jgi:hypothetical protein
MLAPALDHDLLRTRCRWAIASGMEYAIRIDNQKRATQTSYRLCAR